MDNKEIIATGAVVVSVASFLLSVWVYFRSKKGTEEANRRADDANRLADKANTIATQTGNRLTAEAEIAVLSLINKARMRATDLYVRVADLREGKKANKLTADETRHALALEQAWADAAETLLNSYELACGMYLDGNKLDNERFKRQYIEEIAKLYKFDEPYKAMLHGVDSPYKAIRKVYQEWHDHEKDRTDTGAGP